MNQEIEPYLKYFNGIASKEYNTKEEIYNNIRQLEKDHNVIFSIKSSKPNMINYICKHGGKKRIRSDREDAVKKTKSQKSLCSAYIVFKLDAFFRKWTVTSHEGHHDSHKISDDPAEYSCDDLT